MIRKYLSCLIAGTVLSCTVAVAQGRITDAFKEACDSLSTLIQERTAVRPNLRLRSVTKKGKNLDFRFNEALGDVSWKTENITWLRSKLKTLFPKAYKSYSVGKVFARSLPIEELVTPKLTYSGTPARTKYKVKEPDGKPLVTRQGAPVYDKGLNRRHIALWQSHGRYYEEATRRWEWQRAATFTTVEDMYTQSYVLPFLIPMLENAGAYVMTPRERDTQKYEVVCDNDPSFDEPRTGLLRRKGNYSERGSWRDAGEGFADLKPFYTGNENPFTMGTARMAHTTEKTPNAQATWIPDIPRKGEYAVYISYKTLEKSTSKAHYTVYHRAGASEFLVNQTMGGGTWIYLGTFEFEADGSCGVKLDNGGEKGKVVTADAVRFGGGMGKIARGNADEPTEYWTTSGMPAYMEGALYNMQYSGMDTTVTRGWDNDYTNDYAGRGAWVSFLAGGSEVNPKQEEGLGIPFDLSFAFHSDAGLSPNDSIVGTLAIYTLKCDDSRKLPSGEDRITAREYTDYVQTQICSDVRALHDSLWSRRQLWDRSYSESRTTSVPGMLLEILAHQNFADMKYGLDPAFRFTVSRAVYKGMLKYLANRYGRPYTVQPLPVNSLSAMFSGENKVFLSWKPTRDNLEPTAVPAGYIIYTRVDDGPWTELLTLSGEKTQGFEYTIDPGHIHSFKVCAYNDGGISFPSEILAAGTPEAGYSETVLIVNNFTRVSSPAWFDTPTYAGFDSKLDNGVPYIKEINYTGSMYQFDRQMPWTDDDNPGFGASYTDEAGKQIAGNTFDYPYIHGKTLLDLGIRFCSRSTEAFQADGAPSGIDALDIICGKQVTVCSGRPGASEDKYSVFPEALQNSVRSFCERGGNVLISGANIGTDVWDKVYPVQKDSVATLKTKDFVTSVLGYKWVTNYASRTANVKALRNAVISEVPEDLSLNFANTLNEEIYCVETPDGLLPADNSAAIFLRYTDTNVGAGIAYSGKGYKVVSLGFPLEVIESNEKRSILMGAALQFFRK